MKTPTIGLIAMLATTLSATAQERSAELQVLDRFIGTWDIEFTYQPIGGEEFKAEGVSHRSWSTKGTILRFDDPGSPDQPELQILMTYDPETGAYPGVMMSGASRGELTGKWDEKTQTMLFSGSLPDGGSFESAHRFVDANHADPKGVFKNADGEVVANVSWKQTRRTDKSTGQKSTTSF